MKLELALAGDTMLGRGVGEQLARSPRLDAFCAPEIVGVLARADFVLLNLECCISARGTPWPDPRKPFFFRAPPAAAPLVAELGVDCVTSANNHALDFGYDALADTGSLLEHFGVRVVGAGADERQARAPVLLDARGVRIAVVAVTDHPRDFAAGAERPGVAWADLRSGVPSWLTAGIGLAREEADVVLVTPHWGPNMTPGPPRYVVGAAESLLAAGATLVAGHSAHVFHGVADRVLYDMGDFVDDYVVHPGLRNDLGLLFLVTLDGPAADHLSPVRLDALPTAIDRCRVRPAAGEEWEFIRERFTSACAEFDTPVLTEHGRLVVAWS
ncbi:CapA family protein [Streptacidiphilus rugosus]|uniref:CapA family protein n=1 Tax=Streptacidiphilus rugosus TaxID=405783 RepID=UPI000568563B|nr:CapA family protein [Streptacidiphilus rugosus]